MRKNDNNARSFRGKNMKIYCCECKAEVQARLTDGKEVHPHRKDLYYLPFWKCGVCKNYVGCHHKTKNRTKPLGFISNSEIKNARIKIHAILDPIWKDGFVPRGKLYAELSEKLGYHYHTGEIKSIEEARKVYGVVKKIVAKVF